MSPAAPSESSLCPLYVGTSGFSYPEWIEAGIYPKGTGSADLLPLYSCRFQVVELNYSWYQMLREEAVSRMLKHVPASFRFTAKLTRTMTHEIAPDWREQAKKFRDGIAPLVQSSQLAAILIQLPPSFARTPDNRLYLARLLDALHDLPIAVEFRHRSWARDSVFSGLAERKVTLVSMDAPDIAHLFPPLDVVTNPEMFYIRFHGRNARGWRSGTMQQKFDYDYKISELEEWSRERIPRMARQCGQGLLFFNNHVAGKAIRNAETMVGLLAPAGSSSSLDTP